MNNLSNKTCVPCQGGTSPLTRDEFIMYLDELSGWEVIDQDTKINKEYTWRDFQKALDFVNKIGKLAEEQGHHPDIFLHNYKQVAITLYTHKIGGLHENDFIMAAKIDELAQSH
jgi:4a-hydroxytetrahydrobiopterin dehydratase